MRYLFVVFALFVGSCAKNPATGDLDIVVMSQNLEYDHARQLSKKYTTEQKLYKNDELHKYVRDLSRKIYLVGERPGMRFNTYLLKDSTVNAFTLPGYIFVNSGILPFLMDEAALAGVLGHEAGHINARHMVANHSRAILIDIAQSSIGGLLGVNPKQFKTDFFANQYFSRDNEYQADELSVRYLTRLNIPPENSIYTQKALGLLKDINYKTVNLNKHLKSPIKPKHEWHLTHPLSEKRAQRIAKKSDKWVEEIQFYNQDKYYKLIDGMNYGESGDNIFIVSSALKLKKKPKSYGYKNILYMKTAGLKLTLPEKYQAKVMNTDPDAINYEDSITLSSGIIYDDPDRLPIDIICDLFGIPDRLKKYFKLYKQHKQKQEDPFSTFESVSADSPVVFKLSIGPSIFHKLLGVDSQYHYYSIMKLDSNKINQARSKYLVFDLSTKYKKSFDEIMQNDIQYINNNIIKLTKQQAKKLKPLKIKTIQAEGTESFAELAEKYTPYINFSKDWFRAMNGIYETDFTPQIKKGQWLKLIVNNNEDIYE